MRAAALCWLAARTLETRMRAIADSFERGAVVMQLTLANNEEDRALIGRMSGAAGKAFMEILGIGEDGKRVACPEGQVV